MGVYSVLVLMHMSACIYLCICPYTRSDFLAMSPDSSDIRELHTRNAYFKYCINFDSNAISLCK